MPDTKITALTAISTVDPAVDVLPIVDVSDTTMAASGTTKKITSNQILGAGGTATLASATITGDLTVDTNTLFVNSTNNRVGIGTTSPVAPLDVRSNGNIAGLFLRTTDPAAAVSSAYIQAPVSSGFSSTVPIYGFWYQNSGMGNPAADTLNWIIGSAESMRLNSTGLGVGTTPANGIKLATYVTTAGGPASSGTSQSAGSLRIGAASTNGIMDMGTAGSYSWIQVTNASNLATNYDLVLNPNGGNVGVGVTPSTWWVGFKAYESSNGVALLAQTNVPFAHLVTNAYDGATNWKYKVSSNYGLRYAQDGTTGNHLWFNAGLGTAGNNITWTQAMTLDASGRLLIGKTSGVNNIETVGAGVDGRGSVTGVSTVATTIYTIKQSSTAAMCVVFGDDGSNGFCDIVLFLATVAPKVVSSQTLYGSPAARTYTASTTNLQLALASGTLTIRTAALSTLNA